MEKDQNKDKTHPLFEEMSKINYKKCSSILFRLSPYEFSALGYLAGLFIATTLTTNEQNSFGNWLQLVGQTILAISAQAELFQPESVSQHDFDSFKKEITEQLDSILKKK